MSVSRPRLLRRAMRLACAGLASVAGLSANDALSATIQDFDAPGTSFILSQHGEAPAPVVAPAGLSGNYLALLQDSGSLNNSIAFDLTDGRSDNITIEFDYVMPDESTHTGCCGQRADGFSIVLLNADQYGASGAAPGGIAWERPGLHNSLAIGFDIFDDDGNPATAGDGNTISVFRNGQRILNRDIDPTTEMLLNNSTGATIRPNHVIVSLENLSTNPTISMTIVPNFTDPSPPAPVNVFTSESLPMVMPFAAGARLAFGGRTGGAFTSLAMDNIVADFATPIPFSASSGMSQDFDNAGTFYQTALYSGPTAPSLESAGPGSTGSFIRLVHDQGSQNNEVAFDALSIAAPTHYLSFDYRMPVDAGHTGCCGERADGFGLLLLPTATYGLSGTVAPAAYPGGDVRNNWESIAMPGAVGIAFDIFEANSVNVSIDGVFAAQVPIDPSVLFLNNGVFNRVDATISEVGGDSLLTLTITPDINGMVGAPIAVVTDLLLSGLDLNEYRLAFGGRTGGAFTSVDLDNVNVSAIPEPSTYALLSMGAAGLAFVTRRRKAKQT